MRLAQKTPLLMIGCGLTALIALLALPWVSSSSGTLTLLDVLRGHGHGWQIVLFILGPLGVAVVVGMTSLKHSRRWQTGVAAFLLLVPALLSAFVKHGGAGARVGLVGAGLAAVCAIALTIRPNQATA